MTQVINATLVNQLKPRGKNYDIWDRRVRGFHIRVAPNGQKIYRCRYLLHGTRQFLTLGRAEYLTPTQARDRAIQVLGDVSRGVDPKTGSVRGVPTLKQFIEREYAPWMTANRRSAKKALAAIQRCFTKPFGHLPLVALVPRRVEQWRTQELNRGKKPISLNGEVATLKAALSKAVEWGFIESHPLTKFKLLRVDNNPNVRYLNEAEENRLRDALNSREDEIREARERGNAWRKERGYKLYQSYEDEEFADHLKPMVLLSLNTGMRQGELFSLRWKNINFDKKLLTIEGAQAKSGKTRHIPLNEEALDILEQWRQQCSDTNEYVFQSSSGQKFDNADKSWRNLLKSAKIANFRWHDMRHHFASKLVMLGVDLNTVRELLGHSDIKMTLRYAHLAPEHKASAVEKLTAARQYGTHRCAYRA